MFFPLTLSGPAALTRGIHPLSPFWHLLGGIELSASVLKVAVNAPLKDNGTGHLPRAHSTGRAFLGSFPSKSERECSAFSTVTQRPETGTLSL